MFHLLSFQAKGIALKTHKVLLPCSACLLHKEQGIEDKRSAARRPVPSSDRRARDLLLVGSARARLLGVGFARRLDPLSSPFACGPRRCGSRLGFLLPLLLCFASELLELPFASCALTSVLARGVMPKKQPCAPGAAGRWGALCFIKKNRGLQELPWLAPGPSRPGARRGRQRQRPPAAPAALKLRIFRQHRG